MSCHELMDTCHMTTAASMIMVVVVVVVAAVVKRVEKRAGAGRGAGRSMKTTPRLFFGNGMYTYYRARKESNLFRI